MGNKGRHSKSDRIYTQVEGPVKVSRLGFITNSSENVKSQRHALINELLDNGSCSVCGKAAIYRIYLDCRCRLHKHSPADIAAARAQWLSSKERAAIRGK